MTKQQTKEWTRKLDELVTKREQNWLEGREDRNLERQIKLAQIKLGLI